MHTCSLLETLPPTLLENVDHCVGNQPDQQMETVAAWYLNVLQFHRFWSVDDTQVCVATTLNQSLFNPIPRCRCAQTTARSAQSSWPTTRRPSKCPLTSPQPARRARVRSRLGILLLSRMLVTPVQEFVEFYGGAGVQHIALLTPDILTSVSMLSCTHDRLTHGA